MLRFEAFRQYSWTYRSCLALRLGLDLSCYCDGNNDQLSFANMLVKIKMTYDFRWPNDSIDPGKTDWIDSIDSKSGQRTDRRRTKTIELQTKLRNSINHNKLSHSFSLFYEPFLQIFLCWHSTRPFPHFWNQSKQCPALPLRQWAENVPSVTRKRKKCVPDARQFIIAAWSTRNNIGKLTRESVTMRSKQTNIHYTNKNLIEL